MTSHLLERAHKLIDANQLDNAELVLDAVVRTEPTNLIAWIGYIQILKNREGLEWLRQRVSRTKELTDADKNFVFEYYDDYENRLDTSDEKCINFDFIDFAAITPYLKDENNMTDQTSLPDSVTQFQTRTDETTIELLDVFSFQVVTPQTQNDESVHSVDHPAPKPTYQAMVLLIMFFISINLIASGSSIGQVILGLFFVGAIYWLANFNPTINTNHVQIRTYALENNYELEIRNTPQYNENVEAEILDDNVNADPLNSEITN